MNKPTIEDAKQVIVKMVDDWLHTDPQLKPTLLLLHLEPMLKDLEALMFAIEGAKE